MKWIERRNLHYVTKNVGTLLFYSNCFGVHTLLKFPFSIIMFYLNKDYLCNVFSLSNTLCICKVCKYPIYLLCFLCEVFLCQKFKVKKVKKLLVSRNQNNFILRRCFFQEFFFQNFRLIYSLKSEIYKICWQLKSFLA